jgi:RND family efflux transporter MFP subunit
MNLLHPATLAALAVLSLALLAGCGPKPDAAAGAASASGAPIVATAGSAASGSAAAPGPAASAPPVSVTTVPARQRDLPVQLEATGTVVPVSNIDVRPQMTSVITQVHVKEGQFVKAGQPLFTLDARSDEANVAKLRAQVAKDEATLADARRQLKRNQELLAQNFISQGALDSTQTLVESALASVQADRAAVDAARVTLNYARVTAPAAGRVGTINLYPGSSVQANVTTLVTITQLDPIDIAFSLPQRHLADALSALKSGGAPVLALLPEGTEKLSGTLAFVDNAVDAASGTVKVKARFKNADNKLWPGAFTKVALTVRTLQGVVVVPQAAIVQNTRGPMVFVVVDGKAAARPVQLLATQGEDAAVSGVKPGERVVLDGRQNLRPGSAVVERARDAARGASGAASGSASGAASGATASASGAASGSRKAQP